jgi:hypothetical protein
MYGTVLTVEVTREEIRLLLAAGLFERACIKRWSW